MWYDGDDHAIVLRCLSFAHRALLHVATTIACPAGMPGTLEVQGELRQKDNMAYVLQKAIATRKRLDAGNGFFNDCVDGQTIKYTGVHGEYSLVKVTGDPTKAPD